MVKANKKSRVRKIDASAVTEALVNKTQQEKNKKDTTGSSLFFVDTTGSTQGLSKSAKRALELEKRRDGKGLKQLSELELAKVDRAKLRVERCVKEPEKKPLKSMFDLWDDAEVQENVVVKGTKDNDAVTKSLVEVDGNLKRNMAVGEIF